MCKSHCVLVCGGAGYIGSHTCVELLSSGHQVIIVDCFVNSSLHAVYRVAKICGCRVIRGDVNTKVSSQPEGDKENTIVFYNLDLRDHHALSSVFHHHPIEVVVHFAALKSVQESVEQPLLYYDNNVNGSLTLFQCMAEAKVYNIVFSSSATVYGAPQVFPIQETFVTQPINPYGRTKDIVENILFDAAQTSSKMCVIILRYFNPCGAHPSAQLGEHPEGIPNNLMPYICEVANGVRPYIKVYGHDWNTRDGTGIRDYIHVMDLAKGHVKAIENGIYGDLSKGVHVFNLGRGQGTTVLELIAAMSAAVKHHLPFKFVSRREGDVPVLIADVCKAQRELDWSAELDIDDMCRDSWRWRIDNPTGYNKH